MPKGGKRETMPNTKPTKPAAKPVRNAFTESEVRTAFAVGVAIGKNLDEIACQIAAVSANTQRDKDGNQIDGTSQLSRCIEMLREHGYMYSC